MALFLSLGSRKEKVGSSLSLRTAAAFSLQHLCHRRSRSWVEKVVKVVPVIGGGGWLGFESVDFHLLQQLS